MKHYWADGEVLEEEDEVFGSGEGAREPVNHEKLIMSKDQFILMN